MDRQSFEIHSRMEGQHWWFEARRRILRQVVDRLVQLGSRPRVLDLGCGVGSTLVAFKGNYSLVGIDPSADAIEFARSRHPEIEFRVGSLESAAGDIRAADVVLLNDVIEHVPEDRPFTSLIAGSMKPGALLLLTVPADMRLWSPHDVALGHYRRYSPATLDEAVRGLPLEKLFESHFNSRLYPLILLARTVTRLTRLRIGGAGTDLHAPPTPVNALLRGIFAGEAVRICGVIDGQRSPYRHGVSLIAAYRRTA